jgi:hypothetical protein
VIMAEQTLGEALAYVEAIKNREINSDADMKRVLRAFEIEAELEELQEKAILYGLADPDKERLAAVEKFVKVKERHQNSAAVNDQRPEQGAGIRAIIKEGFFSGLSDMAIGHTVGLGDSRVKQIRLEMGLKKRAGRRKN